MLHRESSQLRSLPESHAEQTSHYGATGFKNNFATTKTIVNDRARNVKELFYNDRNQLVMRHEYTGRAEPSLPTTDSLNRPTGKLRPTDPDLFETRYEYNSDSLLTRKESPNGNLLEQTYDSFNLESRNANN